MSNEREAAVTLKGNPITLVGPELKVGDKAPDFTCDQGLVPSISLADMGDSIKVFNVVLSVDTPVCSAQTRRFNEEAANITGNLKIYTVSADLPFAQKRFCGAEGIDRVGNISDYRGNAFGEAFGILIKDKGLLARAVFVLDKDNTIKYVEYVSEIATEPNFDSALEVVKSLV
ncbi:MAG: thiol peroxidase [Thermodesulfobacteriota bacteirum]|jgi:thioredoxin-dependent peroxiredoxin|nr:thiol peroxidase [Thermodesulfobacteriota bacterium]